MSQSDAVVLPYGNLGQKILQEHRGSYDFFLASKELQENTGLKQRRYNRKKIRLVAMVLLVTAILFGIYAAYGGTIVFNEVGTAVGYFEPGPAFNSDSSAGHSAFLLYYFDPFSGSYHNGEKSMVNALYASGLGYVINLFGDFLGEEFGIYVTTSQVVAFVAETFYSLYSGATAINATLAGAEAAGLDLGLSTLDIIVDGFVLPVLLPLVSIIVVM